MNSSDIDKLDLVDPYEDTNIEVVTVMVKPLSVLAALVSTISSFHIHQFDDRIEIDVMAWSKRNRTSGLTIRLDMLTLNSLKTKDRQTLRDYCSMTTTEREEFWTSDFGRSLITVELVRALRRLP